ncbi:MAG TPA: hypothetical protein VLE93_00690 [Candidatus Saccharimonadales bacterium]|nr:hypothetical protein [Candidatus Saccharimonadales bacterium]
MVYRPFVVIVQEGAFAVFAHNSLPESLKSEETLRVNLEKLFPLIFRTEECALRPEEHPIFVVGVKYNKVLIEAVWVTETITADRYVMESAFFDAESGEHSSGMSDEFEKLDYEFSFFGSEELAP